MDKGFGKLFGLKLLIVVQAGFLLGELSSCESTTRVAPPPVKVEAASPPITKATDGIDAEAKPIQASAETSAVEAEKVIGDDAVPEASKKSARLIRGEQVSILERVKKIFGYTGELRTALDRVKQLEEAQETLHTINTDLEKKYTAEKKKNDDWFYGTMRWLALASTASGAALLVFAGYLFVSGGFALGGGSAIKLASAGAALIALGALLFFIIEWWPWIVGGIVAVVAAVIAFMAWKTIQERQKARALSVIVPAIDKADPMGVGLKVDIANRAQVIGQAMADTVKSTVTEVKRESAKQMDKLEQLQAVTA